MEGAVGTTQSWIIKLGQLVRFGNFPQLVGPAAGSLGRAVCAHLVDSATRQGQLGDPRVMAAIERR